MLQLRKIKKITRNHARVETALPQFITLAKLPYQWDVPEVYIKKPCSHLRRRIIIPLTGIFRRGMMAYQISGEGFKVWHI